MPRKHAIYDKNDNLYLITAGGAELNHAVYDVLKTATILVANALTDHELRTLTLQQAKDLINIRKGRK
jgi:hypothetical protein